MKRQEDYLDHLNLRNQGLFMWRLKYLSTTYHEIVFSDFLGKLSFLDLSHSLILRKTESS
jgi:hypothetical protein